MKLHLALVTFISGIVTLVLGNTTVPIQDPALSQAYAYKDLTVSGLLLVAVIVLYRELRAEQKQRGTLLAEYKTFIELQTKAMTDAADSQGAALGEVVTVLQGVQEVTARQVKLYDETISKLVDKQIGE